MTPWKYYLILFGSVPLWVLPPIYAFHVYGIQRYLAWGTGIIILYLCVFLAHIVSRKWTLITRNDEGLELDNNGVRIDSWRNYFINDSGIGVTQFGFKINSEKTLKILVPKYGKNAVKLEEFLKESEQK